MKKPDMISSVFFAVILIFLTFSKLSNAQVDLIQKLDLDQDGQISIKEAVAEPRLLAVFGKMDIDGNGLLTRDELEKSQYNINLIEHRLSR